MIDRHSHILDLISISSDLRELLFSSEVRSIDGHVSIEEAKQLISSRKNGTDQITRERSINGIEFRFIG